MHHEPRSAPRHESGAIPSLPLAEVAERTDRGTHSWRTDPSVAAMERLRDGDGDAFRVLFGKHRAPVAAFAYRFLHSRDAAEEVAQTVFLQLFRARARYQPKARFTTYLYRIATNVCLNELRRFEHSITAVSLDETEAPESEGEGTSLVDRMADDDSPGPVERLECRETAIEIVRILQRLPSDQRRALLLARADGLSYQEVAGRLDSSVSAVKSLVFRATVTLRRDLAGIL